MKPSSLTIEYVIWQNRAFDFYVAARTLYLAEEYRAAAHNASVALELLLKATLVYHDRSFRPQAAGHRIAGLIRSVRNKAPSARRFDVPSYFFHEQRYYRASRYPSGAMGVGIPANFLPDLDAWFFELVRLGPVIPNSQLRSRLVSSDRSARLRLTARNSQARALRHFLHAKVRRVSGPSN